MATIPTNLPVPSESARDLKVNAGKIDEFVTSFALKYKDRLGGDHYTIEGLRQLAQQAIAAFGWVPMDSFQDGATLTLPNQVLRWKLPDGDGDYYRWDGTFPKVVPAGSTPESTGGIGAGKWLSVGDAVLRGQYERTEWNNFIYSFGGTPDYTGTPLYDGNDATRITATDNTPMLHEALTNGEVRNGVLHLHIPAGHYGFKGEKIILDPSILPYHTLIITGDGEGITILDYIKEDDTGTGNTEQGDNAKELIRCEPGFKVVELQNITLKCTTKTGFVNGTSSSDPSNWAIYNGTVWFAHIKQAESVILRSVTVERGNYRGLSIDGISDSSPAVTTLKMYNCTGRYNTGSGFWLRGIKDSLVSNCYGYRNGNIGVTATGYGITFSQYCSNIIIEGGAYYENYRKGVDKHGGVGNITLKNVLLADNIIFQTSWDHQYNSKYPTDSVTDMQLSDVTILFGRNLSFCNEALLAIDLVYRNHITILLNDKEIDGSTAGKLRRVMMNNCCIEYFSGVTTPMNTYICISSMAKELTLVDHSIDTRSLVIDRSRNKDVYTINTIGLGAENSILNIHGGLYQIMDGRVLDQNGNVSNSLFISARPDSKVIVGGGASIDISNTVLLGATGSGRAYEYQGIKKIDKCTIKIRDLQNFTHLVNTGSGLGWIDTGFFLKNVANQINYGGCVGIGLGDCNTITDLCFGVNDCGVNFKIPNTKLVSGSSCGIITATLYGDISIRLEGRCLRSPDIFEARWLNSSNTYQVVTGSDRISSGPMVDYNITLNGVNTNLIAKKINLNTSSSLNSSEYYIGEISANNSYSPKYIGMI